ncbi:alcohol dehydrogenase catalytic domain-containing protein [Mycolicibacterium sp.]|uniref:alcohol dehydrogenase catalytic domain-containing protein n=1 Tax=Mycolicibacterium sp. TaxID=2320850 RepID=UPI0037C64F06
MLAVRAHQGHAEPQLDTVPVPEPGPQDVLIRILAAGITPGVLRVLALGRLRHLPTILGAEGAGTIAAVGAKVTRFRVGDRVRPHPNLNCGRCRYCRTDRDMMCSQQAIMGHGAFGDGDLVSYARYHDGALAEYVRAPHWQIDSLPDGVGFTVGAEVNHFATAARALKCAGLAPGATVIVTAPTGSIGAATVSMARGVRYRAADPGRPLRTAPAGRGGSGRRHRHRDDCNRRRPRLGLVRYRGASDRPTRPRARRCRGHH